MKSRSGFVSNSSSSSFIITNKTDKSLSLLEFILENRDLIDEFNQRYDGDTKLSELIAAWEDPDEYYSDPLLPGDNERIFGDESGDALGRVYDYILRDGGDSYRFSWRFKESLR